MLLSLLTAAAMAASAFEEPEFEVRQPIVYRNLAVFPVVSKSARPKLDNRYITLDEGMKRKLIIIKEMDGGSDVRPLVRPSGGRRPDSLPIITEQRIHQGPDVNKLKLINKSGKILILIAGEMVVGGKQDRIVQKDCLIPPDTDGTPLDVFCVEHGRWDNSSMEFDTRVGDFSGNVANPSVRGTAQAKADQIAVWSSVGGVNARLGVSTPTGTLREAVAGKKVQGDISGYVKEVESKMPADACGAVVAIDGRLVWVDAFPSVPGLFGKYWPKLLRSYALDAVASSKAATAKPAKAVTVAEASAFLADREGKASFEGQENLYKLRRTENDAQIIYDLIDIGAKPNAILHTCKMLKK